MNNEPATVVLTFDSVEENVWSVTMTSVYKRHGGRRSLLDAEEDDVE